MKKTYIIPELTVVVTELKTAILEPSIHDEIGSGEQLIKGDRGCSQGSSSSDSYNVWNEDWSK